MLEVCGESTPQLAQPVSNTPQIAQPVTNTPQIAQPVSNTPQIAPPVSNTSQIAQPVSNSLSMGLAWDDAPCRYMTKSFHSEESRRYGGFIHQTLDFRYTEFLWWKRIPRKVGLSYTRLWFRKQNIYILMCIISAWWRKYALLNHFWSRSLCVHYASVHNSRRCIYSS